MLTYLNGGSCFSFLTILSVFFAKLIKFWVCSTIFFFHMSYKVQLNGWCKHFLCLAPFFKYKVDIILCITLFRSSIICSVLILWKWSPNTSDKGALKLKRTKGSWNHWDFLHWRLRCNRQLFWRGKLPLLVDMPEIVVYIENCLHWNCKSLIWNPHLSSFVAAIQLSSDYYRD